MRPAEGGYFEADKPEVPAGQRYGYSLDGGPAYPDPCTVFQPEGVHLPSALHFPEDFSWRHDCPVMARADLVIYELHIGTFTEEGTFGAAIARLDDLVELGATAVEIMPVAEFPGRRNWGYDGVHPFAAHHAYGGPEAFQEFIDAAHGKGLAVFLDVVFNHLGPEGNYLEAFAPYLTSRVATPWGRGFDFDGPDSQPVRDWVLECVWHWIHDFRIDGLRLDAVHAIQDRSPRHLLARIKRTADRAAIDRDAAGSGGTAFVIAESLLNDIVMVTPVEKGGHGLDAEWNEDFHHAVSAWLTGESHGKYVDYGSVEAIETVLRDTFYLAGRRSEYYGTARGKPAKNAPADRFVVSLQNHDHVGNRAEGKRIASQVDADKLRLGACLTLLSPFLPQLFMGEEYGETNPFLYFCSFGDPRLVEAVRRGRKRDYGLAGNVPDPQAEATFEASRLSWEWQGKPERESLRALYRDLIRLRKNEPALRDCLHRSVELLEIDSAPVLCLERGVNAELTCCFNLGEQQPDLGEILGDRTVFWRSGDVATGTVTEGDRRIHPYETWVLRSDQARRALDGS